MPKSPSAPSASGRSSGQQSPSGEQSSEEGSEGGDENDAPMPGSSSPLPKAGETAGADGEEKAGAGSEEPPRWDNKTGAGDEGDSEDAGRSGDGDKDAEGSAGERTADAGQPGGGEATVEPDGTGSEPGGDATADAGAGGDIDADLDAALEDFDGRILSERRAAAGERDVGDDTAGGNGTEQRGRRGNGTAVDGDPGFEGAEPPVAQRGNRTPGAGGAMPDIDVDIPDAPAPPPVAAADKAQLPDDVADAKDDDVVARQLREAAMAEPDPVLREKLWDEYRRYKEGR
jgi:hypothetical protein